MKKIFLLLAVIVYTTSEMAQIPQEKTMRHPFLLVSMTFLKPA